MSILAICNLTLAFDCIIVLNKALVFAFTGFSLLPNNITARISFPARFDCEVNEGFVRWAVGEKTMISNTSCPGCIPLNNGSLYFPSVTQNHAGLYTCFIAGVLGVTPTYGVYLTVAGKEIKC